MFHQEAFRNHTWLYRRSSHDISIVETFISLSPQNLQGQTKVLKNLHNVDNVVNWVPSWLGCWCTKQC